MPLSRLHTKIRERDRETIIILGVCFTIVIALGVFVVLAEFISGAAPHQFDIAILKLLRHEDNLGVPIGPHALLKAMQEVTALGSMTVLALFSLLAAAYSALTRRLGVTMLILMASGGGIALSASMKLFFSRARPDVVPHLIEVSTMSFPSSHAMLSAVVYLSLGTLLAQTTQEHHRRLFIMTTAVGLTVLMGLSRLYLGVHYPTDVLAGWAIGLAWAMVCWVLAYWLRKRKPMV